MKHPNGFEGDLYGKNHLLFMDSIRPGPEFVRATQPDRAAPTVMSTASTAAYVAEGATRLNADFAREQRRQAQHPNPASGNVEQAVIEATKNMPTNLHLF